MSAIALRGWALRLLQLSLQLSLHSLPPDPSDLSSSIVAGCAFQSAIGNQKPEMLFYASAFLEMKPLIAYADPLRF